MSTNWATYDLGARLVDVSSEANSCYASNVLDPNISTFWLSNGIIIHINLSFQVT